MQPIRQGTSHIVPVVVAAGLAVGVFCGLLFGLGTKHETAAPSRGGTGPKQSEESQIQAAQVSTGSKLPDRPRTATGSAGSAAASAAGPAAGSAAGSAGSGAGTTAAGTGSAAGPGPGKLKIDIEPDSAAQAAKVSVDGIQITGTTVDIPFDPGVTKKSVKIVVRVPGYKDMERMVEVESDASSSISFDLKGVRVTAAPGEGSKAGAGDNPSGGGSGGGTTGAAGTGGGSTGGGGAKTNGGGSKSTGGSKGKGKGSSGLIDI